MKLTKTEREHTRKALAYLGLGLIADDVLDWIDERRVAAKSKESFKVLSRAAKKGKLEPR